MTLRLPSRAISCSVAALLVAALHAPAALAQGTLRIGMTAADIPLTTGPNRLPLGVQVVGRIGDDARTLACAHWIEQRLRETIVA